jgi:hypothetical protein
MHVEIISKHVNFTQPKFVFGQAVMHRSGREGVVVGMKFTGYAWGYEVCFLKPLAIGKEIQEQELKLKPLKVMVASRC